MQESTIINLFGAPGAGKSTTAAALFAKLKLLRQDCELVTEYAKSLVWENRSETFKNQFYISAKQDHAMFRLLGKVKFIITDSPLLLGLIYQDDIIKGTPSFEVFLKERVRFYNSINYYIRRTKTYNPKGRNQTEEQSNYIANEIHALLINNKIDFLAIDGDISAPDVIIGDLLKKGKI